MELWVRSQDKCRLVPKPDLYAVFDKNNNIAYIGSKMVGHIGKYKSLERALEILDEIQNAFLNKWSNNVRYENCYDNERPRILVYEMPKE